MGRETNGIAVRRSRVRENGVGVCPSLTLEIGPGSGRTLAACLKHASRTNKLLASRCLEGKAFENENSLKAILSAKTRKRNQGKDILMLTVC